MRVSPKMSVSPNVSLSTKMPMSTMSLIHWTSVNIKSTNFFFYLNFVNQTSSSSSVLVSFLASSSSSLPSGEEGRESPSPLWIHFNEKSLKKLFYSGNDQLSYTYFWYHAFPIFDLVLDLATKRIQHPRPAWAVPSTANLSLANHHFCLETARFLSCSKFFEFFLYYQRNFLKYCWVGNMNFKCWRNKTMSIPCGSADQ